MVQGSGKGNGGEGEGDGEVWGRGGDTKGGGAHLRLGFQTCFILI